MMQMKVIKEGDNLYHVFIGDKDIWLSRMELIELRRQINALAI